MDTLRARVCLYVICRSRGGDSRRELALPVVVVVVVVVAGSSVNSSVRAFSSLFSSFLRPGSTIGHRVPLTFGCARGSAIRAVRRSLLKGEIVFGAMKDAELGVWRKVSWLRRGFDISKMKCLSGICRNGYVLLGIG